MLDHRIPKEFFYGELRNGRQPIGRSIKSYRDPLKETMKAFRIETAHWEH